jgi:hypothetical protein
MHRIGLGIAVVVVVLSWEVATAQPPPWAAGPIPPGQLFGYSPLVHTIEPFPTKTSGYGHSMFLPGVPGKRVYPPLIVNPRHPSCPIIIEVRDAPRAAPPVLPAAALVPVGPPVVRPLPVQGLHRFDG